MSIDSEDKNKDWLKEQDSRIGFDAAYRLLRANFTKDTSNIHLERDILKNPKIIKTLLITKADKKLVGLVCSEEHKEHGNNII